MAESPPPPEAATPRPASVGRASREALRPAAVRLGSLHAAWTSLQPCVEPGLARSLAEQERTNKRSLLALAKCEGGPDEAGLRAVAAAQEELALALRRAAFEVDVPALYSGLSEDLPESRDGLLALLDLVAEEAFRDCLERPAKLGSVDALVTLLCTGGDPARCVAPHDPATLTPAFTELGQRAEAECGTNLAEIEAEFFSAANLAPDLADPAALRELGARKAKLGRGYFAPGLLRAVVTYNMALLQSLPPETWGADWPGSDAPQVVPAPAPPAPDPGSTLFESETLRDLLVALQRRLAGQPAAPDAVHRIAWALDLDLLRPMEIEALRAGRLASEELQVAILLVGLLCRACEVVAIELQELGVDPDPTTQRWAGELDERIKREVNASISLAADDADAYERACELSRLGNRLLQSVARPRGSRSVPSAAREEREARQTQREARSLAKEAMGESRAERPARSFEPSELPWRRLAAPAAACIALLVLAAMWFAPPGAFDADIERLNRDQLSAVSEVLVGGLRDGAGAGQAFVGTVGEDWFALSPDARELAARRMVAVLRSRGVSRVMVYDTEQQLRIQALGDQLRLPGLP